MKTKNIVRVLAILGCFLAVTQNGFANTGKSEMKADEISNRSDRKLGAYVGILGDPHPTAFGINAAYNVTDYLRASIGYGSVSVSSISVGSGISIDEQSISTFGLAAKFLMPGWNISPAATVGFSFLSLSDGFTSEDYKTSNLYLGLGADWQMQSGVNLGAGMNLSLNGGAPTAPYINVGMFF
jgi:hypothetical protein